MLSVGYRLAPEHPHPAGHDGCLAALHWLRQRAGDLNVDVDRIAVGGASAGAGLAATVVQHAHDQGIPVVLQLLAYPMLDDRTGTRPTRGRAGHLALTPAMVRYGWDQYLGRSHARTDSQPYAAAARRRHLAGLPPAWIGVGDLDLLTDEVVEYAARLEQAGVACRLHLEPGMYHGADATGPPSAPAVRHFRNAMRDALRPAVTSCVGPAEGAPARPSPTSTSHQRSMLR